MFQRLTTRSSIFQLFNFLPFVIVTHQWRYFERLPLFDSAGTNSDLSGFLVGLDRLMLATSTGVTKSGVTGAAPCDKGKEPPLAKITGEVVHRPITQPQ